jgi:hypothetical protein
MERIKHKAVVKIHRIFRELANAGASYFNNSDQSIIRFDFSTNAEEHIVKIKFPITGKIVQFFVPVAGDCDEVKFHCRLKTLNIVRDIDRIYTIKNEGKINMLVDLKKQLGELFLWGVAKSNRVSEVNCVTAIRFADINSLTDRSNTLAFGVIERVERYGNFFRRFFSDDRKVKIVFDDCTSVTLPYDERLLADALPGRLFIQNSIKRFAIMPLKMAMHRMTFSQNDLEEMSVTFQGENRNGNKNKPEVRASA